ncbi:hypothetical protein BKP42_53780 [Rhodococcus erythropolis]|nr:hypothetical protein BKP42_53780 [Rhodococcus erythropolis]
MTFAMDFIQMFRWTAKSFSLFWARPDRVRDFPFWSDRARPRPLKGTGAQFRWPDKD